MITSAVASIPLLITGLALLWTLKSVVGLGAIAAYIFNIPIMSALGFVVNKFVWKGRKTKSNKGMKRWAIKWAVKEGPMHLAGPVVFALLLDLAGFPLLFASIGKSATMALPAYALNNWVFASEGSESEGS